MKQLLNTLFVTSEDVFLTLDGENVVARKKEETLARYPLHTLQAIISFSYAGSGNATKVQKLMHLIASQKEEINPKPKV